MNDIAKEVLALITKDKGVPDDQIKEMENLSVKLEISYDSRKKGGIIGRNYLGNTANTIISEGEENDGFSIVTGGGTTVTADEIRISEKVKLTPHGNSVFKTDVRKALENYLTDLEDSGMLEQ